MTNHIISKITGLILLIFTMQNVSFAHCDTIASICSKNFSKEFLSDGQEYRALLVDDQTAEFHLTLYGGSIYRFGACSGMNSGNLIFRVYDQIFRFMIKYQF